MSEVRLVIRDGQRDIHANRHGGFADSVIAALSAEPETIEDLDVALERFIAPDEWSYLRGFSPGADDQPYDAGLVIVDLAARLVVCDSTYSTAARDGYVAYHDGRATDERVRYHLSDDWHLARDATDWQALADQRRRERLAHPPLDARAVLYGQALLDFLARECFEAFQDRPTIAEPDQEALDDEQCDLVKQIHSRWLMTPRDDLRNQMPRQVMIARREYVDWSLQDRKEQWSWMDKCPRGLDTDSAAYRFAGLGTHELVVYYDMVRYLLWRCRYAVAERLQATAAGMTAQEFARQQVPLLAELRERWLDAPDPEIRGGRTHRSIIHNERARLPECVSGAEAMIDDDCPLCQMQAEWPGPTFWNLDGCNMDDDFAFDIQHETREQWEQQQREYEEFSRQSEARQAERERLGVEYPGRGYADPGSVWKTSFSAGGSWGQSNALRLFAIGSHLSELIVDLKEPVEQRELIDRLSRVFGNLREVAQSPDVATAAALIEPVLASFCDTLDAVAAARPDLEPKCGDLTQRLARFLDPPVEDDAGSGASDDDDDDLPF